MKNPFFERRCRYSIRKLSVGACSLMIGAVLFAGPALAEETAVPENSRANTELVSGESEHSTNEADKQNEGEHARENKLEKAEGVATASETAEAASAAKPEEKASEVVAETPSAEAKPKSDKETEAKPEATNQGDESKPAAEANKTEKEVQPDVPKNTEKTLKPKEIKFNSWEELLKWEPGAREDDAINRGSVVLASRRTGHLVNEKASKEAKVQALSNTNSKAKDHASVGGEEFKAYAFDYWQYLDSMVFWEGLVPTPDVIDAGHRKMVWENTTTNSCNQKEIRFRQITSLLTLTGIRLKMITLLQLPTGLVVILMMYLQVWNCNRVVPTRQRLSGMTF